MNKIFAYIRVSDKDQNEKRQIEALKEYCQVNETQVDERDIYIDKASGKDFNRPAYKAMKIALRPGDIVVIKELDRLGRDMESIKKEWQELTNQGIEMIVIDNPILNTCSKTDIEKKLIANIVFELLSYLAEKERLKIRQRQAEGIAAAKKNGQYLGRPKINLKTLSQRQKDLLKKHYTEWKGEKITAVKFMQILDLKKNTFYKVIKEYEQQPF